MSKTIPWALWDLVKQIWATWAVMANEYDKVQWNLFFLLKASMFVYGVLLATTFVTTRARKLILFLYYLYSWSSGDGMSPQQPRSEKAKSIDIFHLQHS